MPRRRSRSSSNAYAASEPMPHCGWWRRDRFSPWLLASQGACWRDAWLGLAEALGLERGGEDAELLVLVAGDVPEGVERPASWVQGDLFATADAAVR